MTKGLYRNGDKVAVSYDSRPGVEIDAAAYRRTNYEPPLSQLPTKEEYERPRILDLIKRPRY